MPLDAPERRSIGARSPCPEQFGAPEVGDTMGLWVLQVSKRVVLVTTQVDESHEVAKSNLPQQKPFTYCGSPKRPCRNVLSEAITSATNL